MSFRAGDFLQNSFLVGDQVNLRPHRESDLPGWAAWFNDPEVTRNLEQAYFPNTLTAQAGRLDAMYEDRNNLQLAVVDKNSDTLVGTVGLHQINLFNRNASVSIVIGNRDFWGKRLGLEAVRLMVGHGFNKLNLHKITAGMVASNTASFKLFTELGFVKESVLKEQLHIGGVYQDLIQVGLFRRDWKSQGPAAG